MIFFATLAVIWFFLYWMIGGIFFACVALLRLIRLRKVRFSCLFSLAAALCALAAAWVSTTWMERTASDCFAFPRDQDSLVILLSCGGVQLIISAVVGFASLILIGFVLLKLSSFKDRTWLTTFTEKLELDGLNSDEN
ncbi:MAG: hypothetical protein WC702_03180 [Patescibacteria group bacterium]|jgi:hypothetical protein